MPTDCKGLNGRMFRSADKHTWNLVLRLYLVEECNAASKSQPASQPASQQAPRHQRSIRKKLSSTLTSGYFHSDSNDRVN
ncbi:hypothetical protein M0802_009470 [Mischocyttarus mexicanus]|nr:hypothetical protein M0802_009470 [Mischocyttarus mexicanus]